MPPRRLPARTPAARPVAPVARVSTTAALAVLLALACGARSVAAAPSAVSGRALDTMAERVRACVACHGPEGRASPEGYLPRIAGKPADYLYHQLLNFREGRRQNAAMRHLLRHLSDDYLREIAAHFAALEVPYPAPTIAAADAASRARGESLVRQGDVARAVPACDACHGPALTGTRPATPGLLGLPRDYLIAQLGAWKTGLRHAHTPDCMATIAGRLSDDQISAVAAWLAAQPVPTPASAREAPAARPPLDCGSAAR